MSSTNYNGGTSRCFPNWQRFIDCYTARDTSNPLKECKLLAEDYQECLHHTKEIERAQRIRAELERREKKGDELPKVETRRGLKYDLADLNFIK